MERNLNESYRRLRKWPSQRFSEELINSLLAILRSVSDFLDNRYFSIYQKIGSVGSNRIKEHLPLKNMLGQKRKCSLFGLETHNNSEHLSPASDFTSSDNYSSITEFTNFSMNSTSANSRKAKRRNKVGTKTKGSKMIKITRGFREIERATKWKPFLGSLQNCTPWIFHEVTFEPEQSNLERDNCINPNGASII